METETPELTARPYRPDDLAACRDVFDSNVPRYFVATERPEFEAFLADLPGPYVVLQDRDGAVLACGGYAIRTGSGTADLCWGMVHATAHGRGVGRALTELRIERVLDDAGVRTLALNTSQHTVGFYERLGFRTVSIEPDGYSEGLDRCEMVLDVGGEARGD